MKRTFSPIPKRVMDGSEPGDSVAAAVLSGAPVELQARTVRYVLRRTICSRKRHGLTRCLTESIDPQRQLHNLDNGMVIIGEWIGTC